MASGQPDYQVSVTPEMVILGPQQDLIIEPDGVGLAPTGNVNLINYFVDVDYRLYVTSLFISASLPGQQITSISFGTLSSLIVYWDTIFFYNFGGPGGVPIPQSQTFLINVHNYDSVGITFTCQMIGYRQKIKQ